MLPSAQAMIRRIPGESLVASRIPGTVHEGSGTSPTVLETMGPSWFRQRYDEEMYLPSTRSGTVLLSVWSNSFECDWIERLTLDVF